jgi:hypothetical protein
VELLTRVGFEGCRVEAHFDCFRNTSKQAVARQFGVRGANISAHKP